MKLEIPSMRALAVKLSELGGDGKLSEREWRIRNRLRWHTKARSTVRHMLYGERQPTVDEAKEIEAAHLKHCAEKIEANRDENTRLFNSMRQALAAMEASDPEFYKPHIEAMRDVLLRNSGVADKAGGES